MGALPKANMAVPEFLSWWDKHGGDARFELVDGIVYAMGRDRMSHNRAKFRAARCLEDAINAAKLPCTTYVDGIGVSPNNKNYRLPDAAVNCGPEGADGAILPNPVIVVEVVSPSSEERDVHAKLRDYFAIKSIAHYLIIYDDRRYVVHHRRKGESDEVDTSFISSGVIDLSPPGMRVAVSGLLGSGA